MQWLKARTHFSLDQCSGPVVNWDGSFVLMSMSAGFSPALGISWGPVAPFTYLEAGWLSVGAMGLT